MLLRSFFRRSPADQKHLGPWGEVDVTWVWHVNQTKISWSYCSLRLLHNLLILLKSTYVFFSNPRYPKWINLETTSSQTKTCKIPSNKWTKSTKKTRNMLFFMDESTELVGGFNQPIGHTSRQVGSFFPHKSGVNIEKKWGATTFSSFSWHQPKLTALFFWSLRGSFP